jgi:glutamate N-acetyltransferase/amino-acid N-acetyltransferase
VSVTSARGFRAAGVPAGLKSTGAPDLALVVNDGPDHAAAGVFTGNRIVAAPVTWSRQALSDGRLDAVVLNSGGANACTGAQGFADVHVTAEHVASVLAISAADVAVCSTGLIGVPLPMDKLLPGIDLAAQELSDQGGTAAATAICTTDTVHKVAARTADGFTVGGMAKGAGMLAPGLATMLVVLTCDAQASATQLQLSLERATRLTFDRVDSDGCMSTNDTVLLLASGASGTSPTQQELDTAVHTVCHDLAMQLLADAEGAGKEIRIDVTNAGSVQDAVSAARAISRSNLLKCALHGNDPNWGRVLSALGTTDAEFDPLDVDVSINGVMVCRSSGVGEPRELADLSPRQVQITVDLKSGTEHGWIWTNDLSAEYVHENSAYSS